MISITTGGLFILYTDEKILFTEFRHFLRGNVIINVDSAVLIL